LHRSTIAPSIQHFRRARLVRNAPSRCNYPARAAPILLRRAYFPPARFFRQHGLLKKIPRAARARDYHVRDAGPGLARFLPEAGCGEPTRTISAQDDSRIGATAHHRDRPGWPALPGRLETQTTSTGRNAAPVPLPGTTPVRIDGAEHCARARLKGPWPRWRQAER
jgi:hypothetical protein